MFRFFKERVKERYQENNEYLTGLEKFTGKLLGGVIGAGYGGGVGRGLEASGVVGATYLCTEIGGIAGGAIGAPLFYYVAQPPCFTISVLEGVADVVCDKMQDLPRFNLFYDYLISKAALGDEEYSTSVRLLCFAVMVYYGPIVFGEILGGLFPKNPDNNSALSFDGAAFGKAYGQGMGGLVGYLAGQRVGKCVTFSLAATGAVLMRGYDFGMWAVKKASACADRVSDAGAEMYHRFA